MNRFARRWLPLLTLAITVGLLWLPVVVQAGISASAVD
jgi:hypothetical protein